MNSRVIKRNLRIAFWIVFTTPLLSLGVMLMLVESEVFGPLPTFEELESPKSNVASNLISEDGKILGQYYVQNRSFVDYSELSPYLIDALVSTEDVRFAKHSGIDYIGLMRVVVKTVLMGDDQGGGSTISQQLAKNLFPREFAPEQSKLSRIFSTITFKLKEWIVAIRLERNYTKQEIIAMYFNVVEYGSNAFGIKSASSTFFNKQPKDLNIQEAAMLVGVVNAPTRYSPVRNPDKAILRRNTVIKRMASNDRITSEKSDSICALPIELDYRQTGHNDGQATYFRAMIQQYMTASEPKRSNYYNKWDYEQDMILWETDPLYGWCKKNLKADGKPYNIYRDGIRIYTTINSTMQQYAEEAVYEHMTKIVQPAFNQQIKNRGGRIFTSVGEQEGNDIIWNTIKTTERYRKMDENIKNSRSRVITEFKKPVNMRIYSLKNEAGIDSLMSPYDSILYHKSILRSSFVAMNPNNGKLMAYVGGNNFRFFKYDMARQGKRQVGSTIKPFIYTFGIDHLGLSPCTPIPNSPVAIDGWLPGESGEPEQNGEMRPLWWGLAKSRNNFSTWIIKQSNYAAVVDLIHKMGVRSFIDAVPSMCLGPSDISLYEMVGAYGTFVNMGVHVKPYFVTRIEDERGNIISSFSTQSNDAISDKSAYNIIQILRKVTDYGGTGVRIKTVYGISGDVGGKTGTTNNGSDAWFMGITPNLVAGCWVGGENRSIHPVRDAEGSRLALPIYGIFMRKVYANKSLGINRKDKFRRPAGVTSIDCSEDDVILNRVEEDDKKQEEEDFFQ